MTASPPPAADFADWLSPMLVKELRQGVRTRVFVTMFILLQVAMLLDVSLSLLVASTESDTTSGTVIFWLMVGVPILLVLPMSGLGAVGGEIQAKTLELIFLTRLSALRIIVGKWLAIFAQSLLLVCAVLPYLVLRYFIGGVNVTAELLTLVWMLVGSALLSAAATGLSVYPTRIVRILAGVGATLFFLFGINLIGTFLFVGRAGPGAGPDFLETAGMLICGALVAFLMLEIGAAKIAPPAENHSAPMRLVGAGCLLVALVASWLARRPEVLTLASLAIAAFVCAIAAGEEPRLIPSIFRPFTSRGLPGRWAGRLLYPGWPTGGLFTLVVFAAFGGLMWHQKMLHARAHAVEFISLFGAVLFPVAVIRVCAPRTKKAATLYVVIQIACLLITLFCVVSDGALGTYALRSFCSVLPLSTLVMSLGGEAETATRLMAVSASTGAGLLALLIVSVRPLRRMRETEKASLQPFTDAPLA